MQGRKVTAVLREKWVRGARRIGGGRWQGECLVTEGSYETGGGIGGKGTRERAPRAGVPARQQLSREARSLHGRLLPPQKLVRMRSLGTPFAASSSFTAAAISFCPHSTAATPAQSDTPSFCGRAGRGELEAATRAVQQASTRQAGGHAASAGLCCPHSAPTLRSLLSQRGSEATQVRMHSSAPWQTRPARSPGPPRRRRARPARQDTEQDQVRHTVSPGVGPALLPRPAKPRRGSSSRTHTSSRGSAP